MGVANPFARENEWSCDSTILLVESAGNDYGIEQQKGYTCLWH